MPICHQKIELGIIILLTTLRFGLNRFNLYVNSPTTLKKRLSETWIWITVVVSCDKHNKLVV